MQQFLITTYLKHDLLRFLSYHAVKFNDCMFQIKIFKNQVFFKMKKKLFKNLKNKNKNEVF